MVCCAECGWSKSMHKQYLYRLECPECRSIQFYLLDDDLVSVYPEKLTGIQLLAKMSNEPIIGLGGGSCGSKKFF